MNKQEQVEECLDILDSLLVLADNCIEAADLLGLGTISSHFSKMRHELHMIEHILRSRDWGG